MSRGTQLAARTLYFGTLSTPRLLTTGRFVCQTWSRRSQVPQRHQYSTTAIENLANDDNVPVTWPSTTPEPSEERRLDPSPDDYTLSPFTDECTLTVQAGAGGHGCISFLREKFIPDGPANGGDGGTGGSVFIQAVRGETSLHKLARRGMLRAGRGKNGKGKGRGGERGEDILIQVPVGTIVRELSRQDPVAEELAMRKRAKGFGADSKATDADGEDQTSKWRRDKWLLYPGGLPKWFTSADFPALPRPRRSNLSASQPTAPMRIDLDSPMDSPMLLAAGAVGGLGNPHFVTKNIGRPKYATKGDDGMTIQLQLELKLIADVGLVGLPNAGKSTLLRALTRSRARVGDWAFTTLQPNVGTVILDDFKARPFHQALRSGTEVRESFTIADIPGLIEGAHLDKGLGLGFLRHVERAGVLAFVVDLSKDDAVETLKSLWAEVSQYERLREVQLSSETQRRLGSERTPAAFDPENPFGNDGTGLAEQDEPSLNVADHKKGLEPLKFHSISAKPWLVIATKADLPETQENFQLLRNYLHSVQEREVVHPSGRRNAWCSQLRLVPVSAIQAQGVDRVVPAILDLLRARNI
ncbi:P-loop containing nucleoside triphosphate hydrolase protein [Elsinoe ampelina]|uniref:P-loop containing nucleoside triphosphate hydrolase protein n=1 Tax=Elsinoe ampelina TaxID=302913 RepID=A0A6A6GNX8_9PEZI|nr:P-loop containing nucleoside triphosphate hydrolase protein [Elsinoe ampelina]